jgi:hypothetical protein
MPVLLHGVSQRIPPRRRAGENLQFATAVIVEPLDTPLAGCSAIFENLGWFRHAAPPSQDLEQGEPRRRLAFHARATRQTLKTDKMLPVIAGISIV